MQCRPKYLSLVPSTGIQCPNQSDIRTETRCLQVCWFPWPAGCVPGFAIGTSLLGHNFDIISNSVRQRGREGGEIREGEKEGEKEEVQEGVRGMNGERG